MRISETRESPLIAKTIRLICPHCNGTCFPDLPYKPTAEQRQQAIRNAIEEHRKICTAAPVEAERVYEITYPR